MVPSPQPHLLDPVLSEETVLSLVRRHVPDARALAGIDESGGEARTYLIDDHLVLNTQRPHRVRPRTSLGKYAFFLDQLASDPEIVVPQKLGYGREGTIEYLCMTRIPGVAMRNLTLEGSARRDVLRTLGRTLRRIHQAPQAPFLESGLFPETSLEESFAGAVGAIFSSQVAWSLDPSPQEVAAKVLAALPPSEERVALHANPGPVHVFVDPETGRFSGLIDFGDAYISHPALDLQMWSDPEDRAALLEEYTEEQGLDDAFMATWQAGTVLAAMNALWRRPEQAAQAQRHLSRLLAEY
ncbi:MAG: aminoglycoside phosphotransferase family protein [Chloroflexota bacterium]